MTDEQRRALHDECVRTQAPCHLDLYPIDYGAAYPHPDSFALTVIGNFRYPVHLRCHYAR